MTERREFETPSAHCPESRTFFETIFILKYSEVSETPNPALEICKFATIDGNFNNSSKRLILNNKTLS